jgi:hypothetical protein
MPFSASFMGVLKQATVQLRSRTMSGAGGVEFCFVLFFCHLLKGCYLVTISTYTDTLYHCSTTRNRPIVFAIYDERNVYCVGPVIVECINFWRLCWAMSRNER